MDITFHYPPELFNLLVDTIPLLCRSKEDILLFFRGAGVSDNFTRDLWTKVKSDRVSIRKYEIVRVVLERLNLKGEATLRERREVLKRVVEFESFSACWPDDQLKARGLVAEIQKVVNIKDSFTRMKQEKEKESQKHQEEYKQKLASQEKRRQELNQVKSDLYALFKLDDVHKRGKALEAVINRLFKVSDILIREAFTLQGTEGEGIVEQVDGVVEIDGTLYLVEMKWWGKPIGKPEIAEHLVRVFTRGHARGIFISNSNYTEPAITTCRESLSKATVILCLLEEIV